MSIKAIAKTYIWEASKSLGEWLCHRGSGDQTGKQTDKSATVVSAGLCLYSIIPRVDESVILEWTTYQGAHCNIWVWIGWMEVLKSFAACFCICGDWRSSVVYLLWIVAPISNKVAKLHRVVSQDVISLDTTRQHKLETYKVPFNLPCSL